MFNIVDLSTQGVSNFYSNCYLFGRVAEWSRVTLARNTGYDDSLVELDSQDVNARNVVSENKVLTPEEQQIFGLIVKMMSADRSAQLHAMDTLQKMVLAPRDAETIKALIIQFTDFLKNLGPVEQGFWVFDTKKEVQLFILGILPKVIEAYAKQDVSIQDVSVLDGLVSCLMESFDNTTDHLKDRVLYSLFARERCAKSTNSKIVEEEVELMISILSKSVFKCRANPAKEVLCSIMQREKLENLSQYESSAMTSIENYTKLAEIAYEKGEKETKETEKYFQSLEFRNRFGQ